MTKVDTVVIHDYEERYAPPESPVLEVSYVGPGYDPIKDPPLVFLSISKYDETHESSSMTKITTFGVEPRDLINALITLGALRVHNLDGLTEQDKR